jgi:hypothetical protein
VIAAPRATATPREAAAPLSASRSKIGAEQDSVKARGLAYRNELYIIRQH